MILTCPACSTSFNIDESALGSRGRKVRCGKCAYQWHQNPTKFEAAAMPFEASGDGGQAREAASVPPPGTARGKRVSSVKRPRRRGAVPWGWVFFLIVGTGLLVGALLGRDLVTAKLPQMARIYEMVGFPAPLPGEGLTLENVNSLRRLEDNNRLLIVEGEVLNITQETIELPWMRASLYDGQGSELLFWTFTADAAELAPGESVHFETSTQNPPSDGANLAISFTAEVPPSLPTDDQEHRDGEADDQ